MRRGLVLKHDILMDQWDALYKRSKEVYEETTQGGHSYKNVANRENPVAEPGPPEKKFDKIAGDTVKQGIKRKGSQKKSEMKSY